MGSFAYGSQQELRQHLIDPARRQHVNRELLETNVTLRDFAESPAAIQWLSPDPQTGKELKDSAWHTVGLRPPTPQEAEWWPRSGPTWDGVARVVAPDGRIGAIFAEAKGRVGELRAGGCKSTDPTNLAKITNAFRDVQHGLGVPPDPTWLRATYQPANRLAWLWFAHEHPDHAADPLPVWLVSIYFCGIAYGGAKPTVGPQSEAEWRPAIHALHDEMGLGEKSQPLLQYWSELFLPSIIAS